MNYKELIKVIYRSAQCDTSKVRMMLTVTHPYSTFKYGVDCNNHSDFYVKYGCGMPWVIHAYTDFAIRYYSDRKCYSGHFHGCKFNNVDIAALYNMIINETDIGLHGIKSYDQLLKFQADSDIDAWLMNDYI